MNFNLTKPCSSCPFRTDVNFSLTNARVREILTNMTEAQATFSCHKTVDYTDEDEEVEHIRGPYEQHCAGALILLEHVNKPNRLMRISERLGHYDRTKLKMDAPVFTSVQQMRRVYRQRNAVGKQAVLSTTTGETK